jgi:hypothetical protein
MLQSWELRDYTANAHPGADAEVLVLPICRASLISELKNAVAMIQELK